MTFLTPIGTAATGTRTRSGEDISLISGMCVTCVEGCIGLCEIGKSAYRGAEAIYPLPFGTVTAGSQKHYPLTLAHFNIAGSAVGAQGIEADSDQAIFGNVNLETRLGRDKGIKLDMPIVIPGLGSTDVAARNWDGLAIGSALQGTLLTVGENVCGMDDEAEIENGRVKHSPELAYRVKSFREWQNGDGGIVVQSNVEDTRLGVLEYAIRELGVEIVELKWGQGAKDIGGEVKIRDLAKAQRLKDRGYIVLPDPYDPISIEGFEKGTFHEFERHSRIGMAEHDAFLARVRELRDCGAKYVFLKTGAYGPADLARAVKWSSEAGIDVLTIDGAGGGTGMSPWRMMNEWGVPTVELIALCRSYFETLDSKGHYVPDLVVAGGIVMEDQIFKALALGAPYVKAAGMARAPLAAAMVGKTIGEMIDEGDLNRRISEYGRTVDTIFVTAPQLRGHLGDRFSALPTSGLAVYTYYERLAQGLRQLMCGARKFALEYIDRKDIFALTRHAAEVTGISFVMDTQAEEVEQILNS